MSEIPDPPCEAVLIEKKEVVKMAKNRLNEYVDAEVSRIKQKYESARSDLAKREAREIAAFLESTCERVKSEEAHASSQIAAKGWFSWS